MAFNKRCEYLFVYSVKDANPNGDPLNANHPRYDEETSQVLVSDVRIKRTIRDQWLREGLDVFVDGESKTATARINELKKKFNVEKGEDICKRCIDTRLFGVTYPIEKGSFSWTGPVQFKWGRSLHRVKPELIQGTAAFTTKETSEQRSFRNEYIVPFALIGVYGIANQYAAQTTGANVADLHLLKKALWEGTVNLITRSKVGHTPHLLLEIVYKAGFQGAIGNLDGKIALTKKDGGTLSKEEEFALRRGDQCLLDLSCLVEQLLKDREHIEQVNIRQNGEIELKGLELIKKEFGDRFVEE